MAAHLNLIHRKAALAEPTSFFIGAGSFVMVCTRTQTGSAKAPIVLLLILTEPIRFASCGASNSSKEVRMKVKEAMHKGVEWVGPDTPVTELAKLMRTHNIGAIPIGENDRLIGMVTDRDIVCKGLAQDGFDVRGATARDVMTAGVHCCREDDDLAKAVRHMETLEIRRLPVINKSKRMVGMLALGDISDLAPSDLLSEYVKSVSTYH